MKYLKKTTALLLSVLLLFSAMVTGATVLADGNTATITAANVEAEAGANVDVAVTVNTTGLAAAEFTVDVDGLTVNSATVGESFTQLAKDELTFVVVSAADADVTGEVVLVTLNVAVPADAAEGTVYDITVSDVVAADWAEEADVAVETVAGTVTVKAEEVVGPAVVTNMINDSTSYAEFEYETIEAALAEVYALAEVKHGGKWCDPTVTLNTDITLTADIEVPEYTTLVLGDNVITKGEFNVNIAGSGEIVANYDIDFWQGNPFVEKTENAGVYTYSVNYQMNLNSKNLTLGEQIYINFIAKPTVSYTGTAEYGFDYYWTANPTEITTVVSEDFLPDTSGRYKVKTIGIPAKDMSNEVVGRFWAKTTVGDVDYYVYSNTVTYSVTTYAANMLADTDTEDDEMLKDMVNYGAAFQVSKSHNLDNLANNILDEADKVLPTVDELKSSDAWVPALDVSNLEDYSLASTYVKSFALQLLDVINVKYNLNKAPAAGVEHVMCVWTKAEYEALIADCTTDAEISAVLTTENCNNILNVSEEGNFFLIEGIPSKKYADTIVTRSMYVDADGNTQLDWLYAYSPVQYCINTINNSESTQDDINLATSLMLFANSARQYFGYTVDAE